MSCTGQRQPQDGDVFRMYGGSYDGALRVVRGSTVYDEHGARRGYAESPVYTGDYDIEIVFETPEPAVSLDEFEEEPFFTEDTDTATEGSLKMLRAEVDALEDDYDELLSKSAETSTELAVVEEQLDLLHSAIAQLEQLQELRDEAL